MTLFHFFLRLFAIIIGVGSLIFVVYDRLKIRLPFEITNLTEHQLYFIILVISVNIFWLVLLLRAYWQFNTAKNKESGPIKKYLQQVLGYIDDTLTGIYLKMVDKIPELCWFLITRGVFVCERNAKIISNIIIGIIIVPRIIASIIFILDIFWFSELRLFYKSLALLLIPLLLDVIFFMYRHLFTITKSFFEQGFYLLTPTNSGNIKESLSSYDKIYVLLRPHISHLVNDPEIIYLLDLYRKLIFIEPYYKMFFARKQHCKFLATLVWRLIYIIGWSYILFIGSSGCSSFPFHAYSFKLNYLTLLSRFSLLLLTTGIL